MLELPQKGAWHRLHCPPISAWELTPPRGAPACALRSPELNSTPPFARVIPVTMRTVKTAPIRPDKVKQPRGGFLIILLPQQGSTLYRRASMDKNSREELHPNWDVGNATSCLFPYFISCKSSRRFPYSRLGFSPNLRGGAIHQFLNLPVPTSPETGHEQYLSHHLDCCYHGI
jgi:hypothetical protein